ncbi:MULTISPECIES: hypothetical protein, partial [Nostoc]|uniref:hypothetical protein n=1 Tax=Nostoc TaxID=1177 RepID=UPI001A7E5F5F
ACIGITVETKIRATTPLGCARSFDRQLKFPWAQKRTYIRALAQERWLCHRLISEPSCRIKGDP